MCGLCCRCLFSEESDQFEVRDLYNSWNTPPFLFVIITASVHFAFNPFHYLCHCRHFVKGVALCFESALIIVPSGVCGIFVHRVRRSRTGRLCAHPGEANVVSLWNIHGPRAERNQAADKHSQAFLHSTAVWRAPILIHSQCLCSAAIDLKCSNATTYSGVFGKYNELQQQEFKYSGVVRAGDERGLHKWSKSVCFLFALVMMRVNCRIVLCLLCPSRCWFSFSIAVSLSLATSFALLASNTCFEMTYSHSQTLSVRVCMWERHTERDFVVSRAFSLAPEALAKSAVRFGSILSTLHIQCCTHTHTASLSLFLIPLTLALTHLLSVLLILHTVYPSFAFLGSVREIQLVLMV